MMSQHPDTFMSLPGTLPLDGSDYSDFGECQRGARCTRAPNAPFRAPHSTKAPDLRADDFLSVPQHGSDFALSTSSSLDVTDLFLGDLGGFEGSEVRN